MTIIGIGQLRGDARHYVERAELGETLKFFAVDAGWHGCTPSTSCASRSSFPSSLTIFAAVPGDCATAFAAGEALAIELRGRPVAMLHPIQPAAVS